jgi:cell division protein FtsW (lipid II flippase)
LALTGSLMVLGCLGIGRYEELVGGDAHFFRQQIVWTVLGLAVMLTVSLPNYRAVCRWSYVLFACALLLLLIVYLFPPINHAHRWIRLARIGVQPSELAKVAFVLALARYLMYRENYRQLRGLLAPLALTLVPVLLVLKEPDLGTALVFLPLLFVMLFAAGARRRDLGWLVFLAVLSLPLLWTQMSRDQKSRITSLAHQPSAAQRPGPGAYQLHQAKQVLALGQVWGSWLEGQAVEDPNVYRLPEAHTDFVFCVLGERFGLPGLALVLSLYGLLVWRGLAIAAATREPFGRLVATGIAALVAVQVVINTGMTIGLLPVTGLPLPLLSYGGSGLMAHCLALGLLANIGLRPGYEVTREPFRWATGKELGVRM